VFLELVEGSNAPTNVEVFVMEIFLKREPNYLILHVSCHFLSVKVQQVHFPTAQ